MIAHPIQFNVGGLANRGDDLAVTYSGGTVDFPISSGSAVSNSTGSMFITTGVAPGADNCVYLNAAMENPTSSSGFVTFSCF